MLAAVLSAAGAPVSSFFEEKAAVRLPPAVSAAPLPVAAAAPRQHGAAQQAVSDRFVRLNGRRLALSLVRAGSAGVAVLSVPETSAVPVLPEIAEVELRSLLQSVSGCRVDGSLRKVPGRQGAIAISAGLDCSGA
ncbi:hypothetical protein KUW17_09480 [Leisingera aquaemixtae]|uniref:hypothetical protein n=1 Tax=Leisingera aquaemixtae TaxID=1396826 RepID=UPI001C94F886|nr:hypothetical protein [Leisingera aquaemixtae]MBY6066968.1 hypothetical protein [Leisingera aquaemixtae]